MPHDGKLIAYIYRGGRCYYHDGPYSLAATQALKAAFPQYWTAIRDYGYAHPQLVPFINEDPMLIVSLVEVGKTRWLVGDGSAYIDTGIIANASTHFETRFKGAMALGARDGEGSNMCMLHTQGGIYYADYGSTYKSTNVQAGDAEHTYSIKDGKAYFDSATMVTATITAMKYSLYLMAFNNYGKPSIQSGYIAQSIVDDHLFVPCQHQGEAGMLDIVSLTFYPNANTEGTFTIEITDKE